MKCPKCKHEQENRVECENCGIFFEKYYETRHKRNFGIAVKYFNNENLKKANELFKLLIKMTPPISEDLVFKSNQYLELIQEKIRSEDIENKQIKILDKTFSSIDEIKKEINTTEELINEKASSYVTKGFFSAGVDEMNIAIDKEIKTLKENLKIYKEYIKKNDDSTTICTNCDSLFDIDDDIDRKNPVCKLCSAEKDNNEQICPFCKETIKEGALKCKHCQSNLTPKKESVICQNCGNLIHFDKSTALTSPLEIKCNKCGGKGFDATGMSDLRRTLCIGSAVATIILSVIGFPSHHVWILGIIPGIMGLTSSKQQKL